MMINYKKGRFLGQGEDGGAKAPTLKGFDTKARGQRSATPGKGASKSNLYPEGVG
jgi:hypothetical protein